MSKLPSLWFLGSILALAACQAPEQSQLSQSPDAYGCRLSPDCQSSQPALGPKRAFSRKKPGGEAYHRGHDVLLGVNDEQWVIGKFHYGNVLGRKALVQEEVDLYLLRSCGGAWEKLATVKTSRPEENPSQLGIEDDGGRIYYRIPAEKSLGIGRHRVLMVVAGDHTQAEAYLEIAGRDTPLFVSDVDGTLTSSELAELGGTIFGTLPKAHEGASEALQALAKKGYRPYYLTARPELSVPRSRRFLQERAMPLGMLETSLSRFGLNGEKAVAYKTEALARIANRGFTIAASFGNTETDAEAYENAAIPVDQRYFYQFEDKSYGGTSLKSYRELGDFADLPNLCL